MLVVVMLILLVVCNLRGVLNYLLKLIVNLGCELLHKSVQAVLLECVTRLCHSVSKMNRSKKTPKKSVMTMVSMHENSLGKECTEAYERT